MIILVLIAAFAWVCILLLPWRPWSTRERIDPFFGGPTDLSDITVLLPARNEAAVIEATLRALKLQGQNLQIILIDDASTDNTPDSARSIGMPGLQIIHGQPLPGHWTGKLWALEQGRRQVQSNLTLLLDADIALAPGILATLKQRLEHDSLDLVSVMAKLRMQTFWEKLLVPAFIFFFKLLYPFALGNNPRSRLGVAAGGCILIRTEMLRQIGAFQSISAALIDDCALASKVKAAGGRTWIGLSHSVQSQRPYPKLSDFWNMVARSAFTQLRYSIWLLALTTIGMALLFWFPVFGLFSSNRVVFLAGAAGLLAMAACYVPTLYYYRRSPFWTLLLPLTATLYLLMTWSSAIRFWRGHRSEWKGRIYLSQTKTLP